MGRGQELCRVEVIGRGLGRCMGEVMEKAGVM